MYIALKDNEIIYDNVFGSLNKVIDCLVSEIIGDNHRICDKCSNSLLFEEIQYFCKDTGCEYDLCEKCFLKNPPNKHTMVKINLREDIRSKLLKQYVEDERECVQYNNHNIVSPIYKIKELTMDISDVLTKSASRID